MKKYLIFFGLYYGYFIAVTLIMLAGHDGRKAELGAAIIWFDIAYVLSGPLLMLIVPRLLTPIKSGVLKKMLILLAVFLQMNLIVFFFDGTLWLSYAFMLDFIDGRLQESNNLMAHIAAVVAFSLATLTDKFIEKFGS